jgi:hypothetical protein
MSSDQPGAASKTACAAIKKEFNGAGWAFASITAPKNSDRTAGMKVVALVALMDMAPDFLVVRKLAGFQLRINELPIDTDFEATAVGWYQDELVDLGFKFGNQLFGQTDRFRFVVSNLTVNDFYFHGSAFFHSK